MKKTLIVVDIQNDFIDGALGTPEAVAIVPAVKAKIAECKKDGWEILYTRDTHGEDYLQTPEGKKLPVPHCIRDTDGWYLYDKVASAAKDKDEFFCKSTFPSLELGQWLEECEYGQVELCGLVSHICVLSNAVIAKAALPEAEIVVDANLTASNDPVMHEKALDILEGLQVTVLNRKEAK